MKKIAKKKSIFVYLKKSFIAKKRNFHFKITHFEFCKN